MNIECFFCDYDNSHDCKCKGCRNILFWEGECCCKTFPERIFCFIYQSKILLLSGGKYENQIVEMGSSRG